jgi:diketogulonate reductase-like aldo/keto reductase
LKKNTSTILNNGLEIPLLGLGTGTELQNAVKWALDCGYRLIDTAQFYDNELIIGQQISDSKIPREEIFITSKVWNDYQGYNKTLMAFEESITKLKVEYLDLYLIHWPVEESFLDTWKAMEDIYKSGRVKAIGVSNFSIEHLEKLLSVSNIVPTINQIEFHPYKNQKSLREFCNKYDIKIEAWGPLKQGQFINQDVLKAIAKKYKRTVTQIILKWQIQQGIITIPKSNNELHIQENIDIFDFEISDIDMKLIDDLNKKMGL